MVFSAALKYIYQIWFGMLIIFCVIHFSSQKNRAALVLKHIHEPLKVVTVAILFTQVTGLVSQSDP